MNMLLGRICTAAALLICILSVRSCRSDEEPEAQPKKIELQEKQVTESSGLAISTRDPNVIWTHNDSGDTARLFAFDRTTGKLKTTLEISNAKAVDWEDLCSFERDGESWLAIGDVGDNSLRRQSVSIYVVKEPKISKTNNTPLSCRYDSRLEFSYEGGPINCEALAYDPQKDAFLLISKEIFRARYFELSREVEQANANQSTADLPQAKHRQTLIQPMVTAADISRDGKRLVVANYGSGFLLNRMASQLWDAKRQANLPLPKRRQGESVCFARAAEAILVGTEFLPSYVWEVELPDSSDLRNETDTQ